MVRKSKGNRRGRRREIGSDSDDDSPRTKFARFQPDSADDFYVPQSEHEYDSDDVEDSSTRGGLKDFGWVSRVRKSIVSLNVFVDGWQGHSSYSGTVVDHVGQETWILTSASLARKSDDNQFEAYEPGDIKIEVVLDDGQTAEGSLAICNLHYNIAIVTIKFPGSRIYLPVVELSDLPECYSLQPRPVVALGRCLYSKAFLKNYGELIRDNSELDCNELLVCTCGVNQGCIGGPVMDFEGRFLGITFLYRRTTPFLPVEIAARCLKYYRESKTLPWLRIRVQALHMLDLDVLESISCKFSKPPSGVLVNKICGLPPEKCGGIAVGDVISQLDGVILYSVAQFTAIFLDKMLVTMGTQSRVTLQAVVHRPADQTTFVAKLDVLQVASDECDKSFQNRWMQWKGLWYPGCE